MRCVMSPIKRGLTQTIAFAATCNKIPGRDSLLHVYVHL